MEMTQFNNIQDPIARAEAMRAQAVANLIVDAIDGLRDLVKGATAKVSAYFEYRRNFDTLAALTDRELDDIGISRGDIPAVASGHDPRSRREAFLGDALAQRLALAEAFEQETLAGVAANEDRKQTSAAA
ncbi:MAG: DUF1127 domain-containing protein [Kiloniellaceae bacterium]